VQSDAMDELPQSRRAPRAQIALPCTLRRRIGSPIAVQTLDVGPDGMRVASPRPLATDERVDFDLPDLDMRVFGRARVLRQQRLNVYEMRFERLPEPMLRRLLALAVNSR
jgi:PilZ domain